MIVTALTETCDYSKAHAASCKRGRQKHKIIFRGAQKTALSFSTSNEIRRAAVSKLKNPKIG
jgi:hypothetical protein